MPAAPPQLSVCVCVCVFVSRVRVRDFNARFSLAGSSSPAVPNELCSAVLSLPLSGEITLWSSSQPSPTSLLTCAHSLINTSESLRKSVSAHRFNIRVLFLEFFPSLALNLVLRSVGSHRETQPQKAQSSKRCLTLCNSTGVCEFTAVSSS